MRLRERREPPHLAGGVDDPPLSCGELGEHPGIHGVAIGWAGPYPREEHLREGVRCEEGQRHHGHRGLLDAEVIARGALIQFHAATADPDLVVESGSLPSVLAETGAGASAAADVAAAPDGGCALTWNEQNGATADALWLQDYGPNWDLRWEVALDQSGPERPPRRGTVAVAADGTRLAVWRRRPHEDWTTAEAWFAVLDAEGALLAGPALLVDEVADDPVAALVGDASFWASWTTWDAASGWTVRGALFSLPAGDLRFGPIDLSDPGDPHRPHCAGAPGEVAVSWEAPGGSGLAVFGSRIAIIGVGGP
jgi:hypothetical protein